MVNLQKLNAATMRETYHISSSFNQVSIVPAYIRKMVLDAWNGYHNLSLFPFAWDATTFIIEWGRYRYCWVPQGFQGSWDCYTRQFHNITVDIARKTRCIDGSLLWDDSIESSFGTQLTTSAIVLIRVFVFNPDKFYFGEMEVEFAGFLVTANGVKPTKKMTETIFHFPIPMSIMGVSSWFGLVNQVSYAFLQAEVMTPFWELLCTKN